MTENQNNLNPNIQQANKNALQDAGESINLLANAGGQVLGDVAGVAISSASGLIGGLLGGINKAVGEITKNRR